MKKGNYLFTSESVTEGHPDKIADRISDAILDEILEQDREARVACEVMITTGVVYVTGEITTSAYVDIPKIVRREIKEIGYTDCDIGLDANTCGVIVSIDEQSSDISEGVTNALETRDEGVKQKTGAGDQGIMFGYACKQTEELMPLPIVLAHKLAKRLTETRKQLELEGNSPLRPDGKTQVTVEYQDGKPKKVDTIVISTQHTENVTQEKLEELLKLEVIEKVIDSDLIKEDTKILINPSGRFVTGGPKGDVGLTGRKIIVDTYGGWSRHGGGSLSTKDATKVDRSATYMARYIAKNVVAAGIAEECEVQLAYAIGKAEPVSIFVDTFGTSELKDEEIVKIVRKVFKLDPDGIIEQLDLRKPIFKETSAYGHFGRDIFSWEQTDKVQELKELIKWV